MQLRYIESQLSGKGNIPSAIASWSSSGHAQPKERMHHALEVAKDKCECVADQFASVRQLVRALAWGRGPAWDCSLGGPGE